jgi:DNA-binding NtrC family response regulator
MTATDTAQKKIIVCDDCDDILGMFYSLLRRVGYQVETVHGFREMQEVLKHTKPDLFVLDVLMPECDGFWIAEELQSQGYQVPMIFITAYDSPALRLNAPVVGAVEYLLKPIDPDILVQKVAKALNFKPTDTNWNLKVTPPLNSEAESQSIFPMTSEFERQPNAAPSTPEKVPEQ